MPARMSHVYYHSVVEYTQIKIIGKGSPAPYVFERNTATVPQAEHNIPVYKKKDPALAGSCAQRFVASKTVKPSTLSTVSMYFRRFSTDNTLLTWSAYGFAAISVTSHSANCICTFSRK